MEFSDQSQGQLARRYAGLRTFRADLVARIHTENNLLFERFAPATVV